MTSTAIDVPEAITDREPITARHLINGQWLGDAAPADESGPPRRTRSALTQRHAADVDAAITAAVAAQPAWAALPAPARGAILITAGNLLNERQARHR